MNDQTDKFNLPPVMILKRVLNERNIYILIALVALIPVCLTRYIGSLDGPMHLHASNIIGGLFTGNSTIHEFFQLTPPVNGNITGAYVLAFFNLILPSWLAEKFLILTYLIGFYASFRYLVTAINPKPGYLTLLIIPFAYNSLFILGYYNFSLALVLLMLIVGFWVRYYASSSVRIFLALTGLLLLLYYTHVVIFTFTLLILGIFTLVIFILESNARKPKALKSFLSRTAVLLISALPGLIMTGLYLAMLPKVGGGSAQPFKHWHYLSKSQYLVGFSHTIEDKLGVAVFIFLLSLTFIIVAWRVYRCLIGKSKYTAVSFGTDLWLVLSGTFLILYLIMPNIMSLKVRFIIVFSILLVVWFSAQKVPAFISLPAVLFMLFLGYRYQEVHIKEYKISDKIIHNIVDLERFVTENETIATFNYGNHWLLYHFQNYVGVEKRVVDLRAPAVSPLFAVDWKQQKPFAFLGTRNAQQLIHFGNSPYAKANTIASHIFILYYQAFKKVEKTDEKALLINRDYELAYVSPDELLAVFRYKHPAKVDSLQRMLTNSDAHQPVLKDKAEKYGIPLSTVIERDALWIYDRSASGEQ